MLDILTSAVLPVFIMAGIGAILGRTLKIDPRPLGRMALYVFAPALIFSNLSTAAIPAGEVVDVLLFQALWLPILYAVCWLVGWRAGFNGQGRSAFLLSSMFMNAANYGLSVSLLAFGEEGLQRALLFLAPQAFMSGTLAIYVASSGEFGALKGFLTIFRMPNFYATLGALIVNPLNIALPSVVTTPIDILAKGAIPTMVVVLGIQIATASPKHDLLPASFATLVRLLLSPALAYGVTLLLGITGLTQQVVIVLAGMPTAVYTTVLATEFNAHPRQVTSAVLVSTLGSMATVTATIWLVERLL